MQAIVKLNFFLTNRATLNFKYSPEYCLSIFIPGAGAIQQVGEGKGFFNVWSQPLSIDGQGNPETEIIKGTLQFHLLICRQISS
jgi:hypothetical protein